MYFALVQYLKNYPPEIDAFRKRHDPRYELARPHLTYVFPVDAKIGEVPLVQHIEQVLAGKKAFPVTFSGITYSWDDLVFLLVQDGNDSVIQLHDELYTGILQPFLRADIEYIPHVTLGKKSIAEAQDLDLVRDLAFSSEVSSLTLIKRENEMSPILWQKEFVLDRA